MAASSSLKEYLKRYESNNEEEEKTKRKKKKKSKVKADTLGVLVVDEDPVWQKPVKLEEEEENDSPDEEKPLVDEDIEVKRMKRLEMLRAKRPFNAIADDGSGWVSLSPKRGRNDTPSPEREGRRTYSGGGGTDLPPQWQGQRRHHTPSPEPDKRVPCFTEKNLDMSSPRKQRPQNDTTLAGPELKGLREDNDFSPPRQRRKRYYSPSPEPITKSKHSSVGNSDFSPPRGPSGRNDTVSPQPKLKLSGEDTDLSPPRQQRRRHYTPSPEPGSDLSPPRKSKKDVGRSNEPEHSHELLRQRSSEHVISHVSMGADLSPPRKNRRESPTLGSSKEQPKTGLVSGRDMREEIRKTKMDSLVRFEQMDPTMIGLGAEPVYRDKKTGERISRDEYLKTKQKTEEKPKEKKLEWGKGLAQKREAEARLQELELAKDKPFARTRDDPELDKMMKERVRWGDPMAHLVKKKSSGPVLTDLGDSEKMKESGFIVPQDIPNHSWIRRGLDAAPNRYGIKPGRHWDGVDRSNGFEKQSFKRMNEKQATEREAYLWSVSDM